MSAPDNFIDAPELYPVRMTAPMPETMSPREKPLGQIAYDGWAQGLPGCEWDNQTETQKRAWSKAADAILAALASSGDHAELVEDATEALQIIDAFPSNQGEVEGRITEKGDRLLASCTRDARLALEALIAEVAALRESSGRHDQQVAGMLRARLAAEARATEAERKLAEEDQVIRDIAEMPYSGADWPRSRAATYLASKEAERG